MDWKHFWISAKRTYQSSLRSVVGCLQVSVFVHMHKSCMQELAAEKSAKLIVTEAVMGLLMKQNEVMMPVVKWRESCQRETERVMATKK